MTRWLLGAFWLVALSIGLNMAASELFGYGTRAGLWFVRRWVRLLPPDQRDRWREEWEADVIEKVKGPDPDKTGGNHHLTAMAWGFWTLRAAVQRSRLVPRWIHSDNAENRIARLVYGLVGGLVGGLANGLAVGPVYGLVVGLAVALVGGLAGRPVGRRAVGLVYGLVGGLANGLVVGRIYGLVGGLVGGLAFGLAVGLVPSFSVLAGRRFVVWARRRL